MDAIEIGTYLCLGVGSILTLVVLLETKKFVMQRVRRKLKFWEKPW